MPELHEDWTGLLGLLCKTCGGKGVDDSDYATDGAELLPACPICQGTGYRKPEPQEVNDWLAVEVKGWSEGEDGVYWWGKDSSGLWSIPKVKCGNWHPLTDANHALRLVAGIKDVNMSFAGAFEPAHHWLVEVYGGRVNAQARSFCEALCLAAAKATAEARKYE